MAPGDHVRALKKGHSRQNSVPSFSSGKPRLRFEILSYSLRPSYVLLQCPCHNDEVALVMSQLRAGRSNVTSSQGIFQ